VRETRDGFDLRTYFIAIAKTSVKRRMRFIFANAAAIDREFEKEKIKAAISLWPHQVGGRRCAP
jgi:hypothetical protein